MNAVVADVVLVQISDAAYGEVSAFLRWAADNGVWSLANTASSGRGGYQAVHLAEDAGRIKAWFENHGVEVVS